MNEPQHRYYNADDLVNLVKSLHRPQDNGLFVRDVLIDHPYLAKEYTRVCPNRCDLATMAEKAARDEYSYDAGLRNLCDDIDLIVTNCIRFNGATSGFANTAESFGKFAKGKIEDFLREKTGGRRFSSNRVAALSEITRGKRQLNEKQKQEKGENWKKSRNEGKDKSNNNDNDNKSNKSTSSSTGPISGITSRIGSNLSGVGMHEPSGGYRGTVTTTELVKLAESLNRRMDNGVFTVDVAEAYPELREAYEKVCPVKMNLAIIKNRATSGYYLGQQQEQQHKQPARAKKSDIPQISVFGPSLAESLVPLRNDVELIVSNCMRFNSGDITWVRRAQSFQRFAHRKIDEFLLCHIPTLKGTMTGVEMYTNARQHSQCEKAEEDEEDHERKHEEGSTTNQSHQERERTAETTTAAIAVKQESPPAAAGTPPPSSPAAVHSAPRPPPQVTVVDYVKPTIVPTALQPVFKLPDTLRHKLSCDYLERSTLRARFIQTPDDNTTAVVDSSKSSNSNKESNGAASFFSPEFSCRAVLDAFVNSVQNYYRTECERQVPVGPFDFLKEQEELYLKYVALVKEHFDSLFLHALLYEREKADVWDWGSTKAAQKMLSSGCTPLATQGEKSSDDSVVNCNNSNSNNNNNNNNNNGSNNCGATSTPSLNYPSCSSWLDEVHLCYLVRFIVHFPQLMALACAKKVTHSAPGGVAQEMPELQIAKVKAHIIEKFSGMTEELLTFIAEYESKVAHIEESEATGVLSSQ